MVITDSSQHPGYETQPVSFDAADYLQKFHASVRPEPRPVLDLGAWAGYDSSPLPPALAAAPFISCVMPSPMPHEQAAQILQKLAMGLDGLVLIELDFSAAPPPAEPGTDFDPALFDAGFVRLRSPDAAPHSWYYGKSACLPSLDWLAPAHGANMIGFPQMGNYGRFGNQLFQWAFLALYGIRNHCRIAADAWAGCEIYGTKSEPYQPDQRPLLNFPQIGGTEADLWSLTPAMVNIDFLGFFQVIPPILRQHRHVLRLMFTPKPDFVAPIKEWLKAQIAPDETLVGIHVRRGDYVMWGETVDMFRPIPAQWFATSLHQIWQHEKKPRLLLASDDLSLATSFAEFKPLVIPPSLLPPGFDYFADFYGLTQCRILLVANSSFSRMASLLASDDSAFLIVNFERQGFEPYQPWQDQVFWDRFWGNSPWEVKERGYRV